MGALAVSALVTMLKARRTAAGLTQAQLAEMALVSRKTVNTVENGVFVPSTALALRLARVLGCRVEDLFALPDDDACARPPCR